MDLAEFVIARIDEDEAVAREAIGKRVDISAIWSDAAVTRHIDRWSSTRVLAETEAKRRTLALLDEVNERGIPRLTIYTRDLLPRLLALPYADHPDYDPAWRPFEPSRL